MRRVINLMGTSVLVVGGGGREHALAWKLSQSPKVGSIFVAPGNGGTDDIAENIPIDPHEIQKLIQFAKQKRVDLTIIGPDDPLAEGIVDEFQAQGLCVFGPTRAAAQIEWSKAFAKDFMNSLGIPSAPYRIFRNNMNGYEDAYLYVHRYSTPHIIKASGLARGKGVYICHNIDEAKHALKALILDREHGDATGQIVIEEMLHGRELSLHALCDGMHALLFPAAQDYKKLGVGDRGPNTGGMGTVVPIPWATDTLLRNISDVVIQPVLRELSVRESPFTGLLYPGLMVSTSGFRVLEFNARFGDPEAQCYMRLLKRDLLDMLEACTKGSLDAKILEWQKQYVVCVVLASKGYPKEIETGFPIVGIGNAETIPGVKIFHAGTKKVGNEFITNGGRVLNVTAMGKTVDEARMRAYLAVRCISFEGKYYRSDIGAYAH